MHRPQLLILSAGLLAAGFLLSCQKENDPQAPIEQVIPLQVGNEWKYQVYLYDQYGTLYDSTGTYTRSVLRDTVINQSTWYILSDRSVVQNAPKGYVDYNAASNAGLLVYPTNEFGGIGYNFVYPTYNLWIYTTPGLTHQPLPGSRQKFEGQLYKVEYQYDYSTPASQQTQKREDWVVPNVGLARWDTYYRNSAQLQRRRELISYRLK